MTPEDESFRARRRRIYTVRSLEGNVQRKLKELLGIKHDSSDGISIIFRARLLTASQRP